MAKKNENVKVYKNTAEMLSDINYYQDRIATLTEDYEAGLSDSEEIYKEPAAFDGLIKHIYLHTFKPTKKTLRNNRDRFTVVDMGDIYLIDDIWNIFTSLCYRYHKRPTLLRFSNMIGISNDTLTDWVNGKSRTVIDGKPNNIYMRTVKKWKKECENSLYSGATEQNSIGCIFALKANYGYKEQSEVVISGNGDIGHQERSAIAEKYSNNKALPERPKPPNLSDNSTK